VSAARPGTRAVSPRHRFDEAALDRWLEGHLEGYAGPLGISQFAQGQSNPTFHLATRHGEYVLRKKPPGELLASAHAIDREYRVIGALHGSAVPVPRTRVYCDDASVIGTAFYVMDYVAGRIFTDPLLPGMAPEARASLYDAMNRSLASLHAFDWRAAGLGDFGKPERFVERQVARWSRQYAASRTDDEPAMERLMGWLEANRPQDERAAITHGDFRIGNLVFQPQAAEVAAILDWELATIGHPFSDLAYNCISYHLPAGHPISAGFAGADLDALGIPGEAEYVATYAGRSGLDPGPDWRFYLVFSLFRVAAIQQGVYARALKGNASSDQAALFGESYRMVARAGLQLADRE
jgi:aminoglycoside phosphotransferase (APT) family kinase protein